MKTRKFMRRSDRKFLSTVPAGTNIHLERATKAYSRLATATGFSSIDCLGGLGLVVLL